MSPLNTSTLTTKSARVFQPLLSSKARYLGAYGGRGSGKSHFFAGLLIKRALANPGYRAVCVREIQKSIRFSARQTLIDKIHDFGVGAHFEIQEQYIRTPGEGMIIFQGLQEHNADSIKSLEGFDLAWIEEAQSVGARSWRLLRPTIRKAGSQIWASWNPEKPNNPIDNFFRADQKTPNICTIEANWRDNPWFSEELNQERLLDYQRLDPAEYQHIWEGGYLTHSEALIFQKRLSFEEIFTPPEKARFYFGLDFGFANDPTALVRCWIVDHCLYIDHAEGAPHIELDHLPSFLKSVPETQNWPIKADCSRPETISYLARRGFKISAAKKWPGSVADGISRLKAFKEIKIHKRAYKIAQEFQRYTYQTDRLTGDVLPLIEDKNNHWIDALRYALDGIIQNKRSMPKIQRFTL
ncbi:PBSX family phage terminase large subunit [Acetobacteraceae bacterium]|nr:PBSX family phage terminase large subunit [Acetobacteraceae bacterium]